LDIEGRKEARVDVEKPEHLGKDVGGVGDQIIEQHDVHPVASEAIDVGRKESVVLTAAYVMSEGNDLGERDCGLLLETLLERDGGRFDSVALSAEEVRARPRHRIAQHRDYPCIRTCVVDSARNRARLQIDR
jgi:hypothetical protein